MSVVYFIKPIGMDGPIKIGLTHSPEDRLMRLGSWCPFPLEILTTVPGDLRLEMAIQDRFFDAHYHHEWFHPVPELLAAIRAISMGTAPADAISDLDKPRGSIVALRVKKTSAGRQKMSELMRQLWVERRDKQIPGRRGMPSS